MSLEKIIKKIIKKTGDSDDGDIVMLMTQCWLPFLDVGEKKSTLVTFFLNVCDIPIGHPHHNMPAIDVGDRKNVS